MTWEPVITYTGEITFYPLRFALVMLFVVLAIRFSLRQSRVPFDVCRCGRRVWIGEAVQIGKRWHHEECVK